MIFYLRGVAEVARRAAGTARKLVEAFGEDERRIIGLRRGGGAALKVYALLRTRVATSVGNAAAALKLSQPTVTAGLNALVTLGICRETTGRPRSRVFVYSKYLDILNEDAAS
jgi:Fic family protein